MHKDAVAKFDTVINLDNKNHIYWFNRGEAYFKLKDYNSAIKDFNKAILLYKNNLEYYDCRA